MKFLIFCVLVAASSAFDFDCLKGPDFWCVNVANAQKCGKISECFLKNKKKFETVVKPSSNIKEDDMWCTSCINLVEFAQENIPRLTQDHFLQILDKEICDQLKPNFINVCKVFVSEYGPKAYKEIQNIKDPKLVCSIVRVCPAGRFESALDLFAHLKPSSSPELCEKCKQFFAILESMFSKISPDEFKMLLETFLCGQLPSALRPTCKMLVSGYSSQLYQLIKTLLDGDRICPLIHMCPKNETKFDSWNCQTCMDIIAVLKKDLVNVPDAQIESYVKSMICSKVPFWGRNICSKYVSNLLPGYLKDIKSTMTPQQICNKNKVCSSQPPDAGLKTSLKANGIECEACQYVITEIKKIISDPNKKAFIKNFLKEKFCAIFQDKKSQCQQLIDEFFDVVFNFIIAELDVQKVCQALRLCSAVTVKIKGDAECATCNVIIHEVIEIAFSNRSEQLVSNFIISDLCAHLGFVKSECAVLVNSYLPYIFSIARSTLDSKVICNELHLCSVISHKKIQMIMQQKSPGNTVKCEICLFVVNELKFLLTDPTIQTAIENFIKNEICVHFGSKQSECVNDINQYYSIVINFIVQFLKPALCSDIGLCKSTVLSPSPVRLPLINIVRSQNISPECPMCVKFYNYLKSINDKRFNSANVVMGLVQLCGERNQAMKSECLKIFRNLDAVIKSYNRSKNLSEFCQRTNMCSGKMEPKRIGFNPCSWGPSFWCQSEQHASSCGPGAVKHCEMIVWSQRPIL